MLKTIKTIQDFHTELGIEIDDFIPEKESSEYYAHTCMLNNKNTLFRIAKKTPKKTRGYHSTL